MLHSSPIPGRGGKLDPELNQEEELSQLLALELMRSRAKWKQVSGRRSTLLTLSILFLAAIVVAGGLGFFFFCAPDRISELRAQSEQTAFPTESPAHLR